MHKAFFALKLWKIDQVSTITDIVISRNYRKTNTYLTNSKRKAVNMLKTYTQYPIIRNGLIRNSAEILGKLNLLGRSNLRNSSKNLRNGQCSDFQS